MFFHHCSYDMTLTNACIALSQRWITVSSNAWFLPPFQIVQIRLYSMNWGSGALLMNSCARKGYSFSLVCPK